MYENPYMSQFNYRQPQQVARVTGIEGAKAYTLQPNSSIALFDSESDLFFLKTTDSGGFPTIRTFKFEPYVEEKISAQDYVTRKEFEELKGLILNGKQLIRTEPAEPDVVNANA